MSVISTNLRAANMASLKNRTAVEGSTLCGCFSCVAVFPSNLVKSWMDKGMTAKCPICETGAVIGDSSGFEVTPKFLRQMKGVWFRHG